VSQHDGRGGNQRSRLSFVNVFVFISVMAVPVILIGPGLWLLGQRAIGTPVQAKVLACQEHMVSRSYAEYCQAQWTIDGQVVEGDIEGSGSDDVGHTISATVRGDTAYSRSLALPLLLIGLGLPFLVLSIRYVRTAVKRTKARRA
jgi:hypothetical protein